MAQCPTCADSTLVHAMLTDGLAGHRCGNCLGTLVSLVSYRAWREGPGRARLPAMPDAVADVAPPDSLAAKKCPKCRSVMSKYRVSAEKANRLDYCPHCEEIWLDDGEWQLVEGLVNSGDFARVFTQAWQFAVRSGIAGAMEDQRLRGLLGADHARFVEFARWLATRDDRQEIVAQLARFK
ncbi:MAG TPA: zf-TFIIB domain-containing protein [Steroidobacteraceae bacterium]|nr:zf-TFIIB domain-containing protein [Steroidobacteraceae bacterium]